MLAIERDGASIAELRAANNIGIDAATGHFQHAGRTERIPLKKDNFQAALRRLRAVSGRAFLSLRTKL